MGADADLSTYLTEVIASSATRGHAGIRTSEYKGGVVLWREEGGGVGDPVETKLLGHSVAGSNGQFLNAAGRCGR